MQHIEATEHDIAGVRVRRYQPDDEPAATMVFAHGGGFSWGTLDDYDRICRNLCEGARSTIISVDYRLAPGHPFPAAIDDVHAVALRVIDEGQSGRLVLAGDSAGACLAAGIAQRLCSDGVAGIGGQLLIYPMIEYHDRTPPAFHTLSDRYHPTFEAVRNAWDTYLQAPVDELPSYAVPPRCPLLSGLPPALTLVAQNDPLRFEGMLYSEQLRDAGVQSDLRDYTGSAHGFLSEPAGPGNQVAKALIDVRDWVFRLPLDPSTSRRASLEA